jgi:itaconyl-CoA hydratase
MTVPPQGYRQLTDDGPGRYREIVGSGYDELVIGRIIEHRPGRTVTETDNLLMVALTGNAAPIHIDAHYSSQTEWGRTLVCGLVSLGIIAGMSVRSTSGLTIANLGVTDVTYEHPVFVGDTLYGQSEITGKRLSKSRPQAGIVTARTCGVDQHSRRVLTFTRTFLVPTDPDPLRTRTGY